MIKHDSDRAARLAFTCSVEDHHIAILKISVKFNENSAVETIGS